jgi:hypothetical protein
MRKGLRVRLVEDDLAERVAFIMGDSSAHAQALRQARDRRAAGEDVVLVTTGKSVLVVPRNALVS